MKKIMTVLAGLLLAAGMMEAVPAYRGWLTMEQPDGTTIEIRQMGDEFYHYWETRDGKIALEQEDGTFVVSSEVVPTAEQYRALRAAAKQRRGIGPRKIGAASMPARALFILVNFSDQAFKSASITYYKSKLGDTTDGAMSMYNYLKQQSNGAYAPPVDVFGPVTLSKACSYYGSNDSKGNDLHPAEMVVEACKALDSEIDFSLYDNNNDGIVDNVYVLYAGKGEADRGAKTTIWPHQWDIYYAEKLTCNLDGKNIRAYACSAELNGSGQCAMGTPLHEFGHVIGLPDYYDTEYESTNYSESRTPGEWSIMDQGSYNDDGNTPPNYSIFDKYYLGWATPKILAKNAQTNITLTTEYGDGYQITGGSSLVPYSNTNTVYYIENRQKEGWDAYLPGHGMIVWQVRYSSTEWEDNTLNNTGGSPRYTVLSASGDATNIGKTTDPFPGSGIVRTFTPFTGCALTDISESGGNITFKYNGGLQKTECEYSLLGDHCNVPADGVIATNSALSLIITPDAGYTLADPECWTVEMGTNNELVYGEGFTYNATTNEFRIEKVTEDVTILAEGKEKTTLTWMANGELFVQTESAGSVVVPEDKPEACEGKVFVGWTKTADYESESVAPALVKTGDAASQTTFYAVYATLSEGTTGWTLVTDASTLKAGDILAIACTSKNATAGDISSQIMSSITSSFSNGTITTLGSGTVELTLGGSKDAWTLTSSKGQLGSTGVKNVAWGSGTTTWEISISSDNATIQSTTSSYGRFLYNTSSPRFTTYTSASSASMLLPQLYRKGGGSSYSDYTTSCSEEPQEPVYYTVRFFVNGMSESEQTVLKGTTAAIPATPEVCAGYTFAGWWTAELAADNTAAKTWVSNFTATKDQDYYAVFSRTEEGGQAEKAFDGNTAGTYKIYALVSGTKYYATTLSNSKLLSSTKESEATNFVFEKVSGGWTIKMNNEYLKYNGSSTNLATQTSAYTWSIVKGSAGSWRVNSGTNGRALAYSDGASKFGGYSTSNIGKNVSGATYYDVEIGGAGVSSTTYYSTIMNCSGSTGMEQTGEESSAKKIMRDGQILIIRGEAVYTLTGVRVE